jgi:hypothetical protein
MSRILEIEVRWIDTDTDGAYGEGFTASIRRRSTLHESLKGQPIRESGMLEEVEWHVKEAVRLLAQKLRECEPATIDAKCPRCSASQDAGHLVECPICKERVGTVCCMVSDSLGTAVCNVCVMGKD